MTIKDRIAYIYRIHHGSNLAGKMVAQGFRNAFVDMGYEFKEFDSHNFKQYFNRSERNKLCEYQPSVIMSSVENIRYLPLNTLLPQKLVLWGQFYSPNNLDKDTVTISKSDKNELKRQSKRHHILIWSQHSDEINEKYFKGYEKELRLQFTQLMHCADKTKYVPVILDRLSTPEYDFVWIGKIKHRRKSYEQFIGPLKSFSKRYIEYTERCPIDPASIKITQLYASSSLAPNVHSESQRMNHAVLNDRVFVSTFMGGFQICDNMLAKKYFTEDEMIISDNPKQYLEYCRYYLNNPHLRIEMIKKAQDKILHEHTYHNRIEKLRSILSVERM